MQEPGVLLDAAQGDALAGVHHEDPPQQVHALIRQPDTARDAIPGRTDPLRTANAITIGRQLPKHLTLIVRHPFCSGMPSSHESGRAWNVRMSLFGYSGSSKGYAPTCRAAALISVASTADNAAKRICLHAGQIRRILIPA